MIFQTTTAAALLNLLAQNEARMTINGWWVIFIFLVLVVVVSLLLIGNRQAPTISPTAVHGHEPHALKGHDQSETGQVRIAEIPQLDDLKKIEGIGPKIASLLSEHGINTFRELANAEVETLSQLLDEARLTFADPSTWPEQARLADLQEWEALEELQSQLKGGRSKT